VRHSDVVIVGGGQAGLAMSRCLSGLRIEHVVLERGQVAERWRSERWDSLRLLTPNWMTRLPGLQYDGPDPDGFMTTREVADFFEELDRERRAILAHEHGRMVGGRLESRLVGVLASRARERVDRGLAERAAVPAVAGTELEPAQAGLALHQVERAEQGGGVDAVEREPLARCLRRYRRHVVLLRHARASGVSDRCAVSGRWRTTIGAGPRWSPESRPGFVRECAGAATTIGEQVCVPANSRFSDRSMRSSPWPAVPTNSSALSTRRLGAVRACHRA
jgi:hypothetical protein